ncbi:MAG: 4-(cytidine 5'-diphospho)-2-C-methyl-D-erythritol kinase [Peptoclostridium sp.]|uniref:4-(cytidine 5'-diphospho)-2-C-methyl-D-erythritol kinase n=1 Tax=Peptoclostridium sp. TaxID=1904860 RepID=UPI00139C09AA|nr:4-(cytidine 5'-diphospho)-2-C-methyl-D-erythritol kinase [Peptoclostridium sp.]MZQ75849.1 4-(cytidine 5'-diphospho)-2-C-methyl-D-erythritol kinase [Peptoclostridium sp.]
MEVKLKTRAKVNFSIDVVGKREDGYHLVEMIMQTIDLYDVITLCDTPEKGISIKCSSGIVPSDSRNIAYKAADLIIKRCGVEKGVKIDIEKRIPVGAGMAGGSCNAAGVLVGLNRLWNLGLSVEELKQLGLELGADVPFCIEGGTALAQGIGEKLTALKDVKDVWIVVCKPNFSVSTAEVYKSLKLDSVGTRPDTGRLLGYMEKNDIKALAGGMANVLEGVTQSRYSVIAHIKDKMMHQRALGSIMTGSGPTVFGIFKNFEDAHKAESKLKAMWEQTYLVKTENRGVEFNEG